MMEDWKTHPDCPADGTWLCQLGDIPDDGGFEVCFGSGREAFRVLLLRQEDEIWAYTNNCPHFSLPLNFKPQTFLVMDSMIVCAHHTAFFRFEDGLCTEGPCLGMKLTALPCYCVDEDVFFGRAPD